MLDIRKIVNDTENVINQLEKRGGDFSVIREIVAFEASRKSLLAEVEVLKAKRNEFSKKIGQYKREKKDTTELMAEIDGIGDEIKVLDEKVAAVNSQIKDGLLQIPNIPQDDVPVGADEEDNVEIKVWGEKPAFDFEPKPHWDIVTDLDIVDFERASKITGSRFSVYKKLGARLERALINFMLDLHIDQHGYDEILPPVITNKQSLIGTGQLPKFEEDLFHLSGTDYYLIPTSEVPVTNLHAGETLAMDELPIKYTAYSACFRSEAGSAGRDTRGLIRQHQFNKVELVKFTTPEDSSAELEKLLADAEKVLQLLELPYRVVTLCTGDIGFSSQKTYDIEVWLPSYDTYREISSCSNFGDFQARRANIKFRREEKGKLEFVHTLNGSGLAIGRTVAAIIENYQQADGTVKIPAALQPYMAGLTVIE